MTSYLQSEYRTGLPLGEAVQLGRKALASASEGEPQSGARNPGSLPAGARAAVGRKFPALTADSVNGVLAGPRLFSPLGRSVSCRRRIYGIETEYGIIFTPEGRKTLPVEKAIRFLFEKLITTEHFLNVFLENGARFYQDTGCHPGVRDARVRVAAPGDPLRQGRRADPGGSPALRRGEDPRGADRREALDLQEQHRLRGQQLRLPRELPGRPRRRFLLPGRAADPVPGDPPDLHRRRQGLPDPGRCPLLRQPASAAHLPEDLGHDDERPLDHQHPRRAPRRSREVPAPPRDRRATRTCRSTPTS